VLRFLQGPLASPDREILIYLRPKPGEGLGGMSLTISNEMRGSSLPSITKLWKTNPRYGPTVKPFAYGYAMQLELSQPTNGLIAGKVFLALPDNEQSVIAGRFTAADNIPELTAPTAPGATAATLPPALQRAAAHRH